jgi:hypothetical protein
MEKQQELSEILFKAIKAASNQGEYDAVAKLSQEWRILNGLNFVPHIPGFQQYNATGGV